MKVLIGCEESQAVTIAFRKRGIEAYSCDLQDCSGGHPEWHLKCDVFEAIEIIKPVLAVFHPPCTYLSNAGIKYFNIQRFGDKAIERHEKRKDAAEFFMRLYNANVKHLSIENPVGYINSFMKPSQVIQPYFFGDADNKRTCLWNRNLPLLKHYKQDDLFAVKTHVEVIPTYIDKSGKPRYFTDAIGGGVKIRRD